MYKIVYIEYEDEGSTETIIYKSASKYDCFNMVWNWLGSSNTLVQQSGVNLLVQNKLGEIQDYPENIKHLIKFVKETHEINSNKDSFASCNNSFTNNGIAA